MLHAAVRPVSTGAPCCAWRSVLWSQLLSHCLTARRGKQQQNVSLQLNLHLSRTSFSSILSWSSIVRRNLAASACWNASCLARSSASQMARSCSACGERPTVNGAVLPATCRLAGLSLLPAQHNQHTDAM